MKNFTHYEKRLRPYEIVGNERTTYLPMESDEIIIRTITKKHDTNTKLVLTKNGCQEIYKPDEIKKAGDWFSYIFNLDKFSYNDKVSYYFENAEGKSECFDFSVYKESMLDKENTSIVISDDVCVLKFEVGNGIKNEIAVYFDEVKLVFGGVKANQDTEIACDENIVIRDKISGCYAVLNEDFSFSIYTPDGILKVENLKMYVSYNETEMIKLSYMYDSDCEGIYATGERFNCVNQKGMKTDNMIFEQFTNQGRATYFPIPFFFTNSEYGVLNNTSTVIEYDFDSSGDGYRIDIHMNSKNTIDDMYFMFGSPKDIIAQYLLITGKPQLPPEWSFGIWVSANRWNSQKHISEQIEYMKKYDYPATALVIEAWSDENTFYIFNEAKYNVSEGSDSFVYDDFHFDKEGLWINPKEMIGQLKEMGIHTVLWQIPVLKAIEDVNENLQHNADVEYAVQDDLCVKEGDMPYEIPDYWFKKSYLPDFTNPKTLKWWFKKRQYLLDIGIDGFKTDGGEFIYKDDLTFYDGDTGKEMKNRYSAEYVKAYSEFVGKDRALFSRASYLGGQKHPIHWAGDQMSTWAELRSILKAGLSMGLSGVPFWSFDIGGFAGDLPSEELYIRSTQLAVFAPIMQWHSEPMTGQFQDVYKHDSSIINDRSPWNMADVTGSDEVIKRSLKYANLRVNLLPYIYSQAHISVDCGRPMMRHLIYDFPCDEKVFGIEDQFMIGDILVAPIIAEGVRGRSVYLPIGSWINLYSGEKFEGGKDIHIKCEMNIPIFLREGCAVALNLNSEYKLYDLAPKKLADVKELSILVSGTEGEYRHFDDRSESIIVSWNEGEYKVNKNTAGKRLSILTVNEFDSLETIKKVKLNELTLNIYNS